MRRFSFISFLILSSFYFFFQLESVSASTLCPSSGDFTGLPGCGGAPITNQTVSQYISKAVELLLVFAVVLSLFFLIWGGVRWIMSSGDKAKVTAARDTIIAAIVGLVLALLAYAILNLVFLIVTNHPLGNFSIPTFTTG